jgi:hypothetical protein
MRIKVLKSIIKENGCELFELKEENIPFLEVVENNLLDIDFYEAPRNFAEAMSGVKRKIEIPSFRIKINGKIEKINGFIFAFKKIDTVQFLEKYYVDGNTILDDYIKSSSSKKEGILKALIENPDIIFPYVVKEKLIRREYDDPFKELPHNFKKYNDFIVKENENLDEIMYYREKTIKVKNYNIKRWEYLIPIFDEKISPRRRWEKEYVPEIKKWLYYDGRKFKYFNILPDEVIKKFDKDGRITFIPEQFVGYNFLKFLCFLPWKKKLKNKIKVKSIKNPFKFPIIFAFDSKIPINIPKKVKIIEDDEIIWAFKYLNENQKGLKDFPIVYFHPSIKNDTEFLILAYYKNG